MGERLTYRRHKHYNTKSNKARLSCCDGDSSLIDWVA
jgi:hypothetical protein